MASRGGSHTLFADHWWDLTKAAQGKIDLCPLVAQMWMKSGDAFEKPILGLSRRKQCWVSRWFWCSYTHTHSGALLLHLIYCEGPTPPSAWCCHLRAEGAVSFCRHLVTTEPAQSKWPPCGCSCHWASKTGSFWGAFAVYCGKVVLSQTKYTVQGTQCTVGNLFTEKTIVLRAKGRPWKTTVASGSWLQMQVHWINESLTLCVCECVKMTRMHGCVKEESQRERLFNSPDRIPWITPFCVQASTMWLSDSFKWWHGWLATCVENENERLTELGKGWLLAAGWLFGSRPRSSVKDPVTSPEGLQLSTSRCRDTGHNHNLLLRAENHAYVPLCALDLHTHFNLLCFFFYSYLLLHGDDDNDCLWCYCFFSFFLYS